VRRLDWRPAFACLLVLFLTAVAGYLAAGSKQEAPAVRLIAPGRLPPLRYHAPRQRRKPTPAGEAETTEAEPAATTEPTEPEHTEPEPTPGPQQASEPAPAPEEPETSPPEEEHSQKPPLQQ
jgi:outer membrane biosynthesis protein TonB